MNIVQDPWSEGEHLRIHGNEDNDHTSTFAFHVNQQAITLKKGLKLKFGNNMFTLQGVIQIHCRE